MKTRLLIIIGIIIIVSAGSFVILFQTQLTNSNETHLSSLLNGDSLCFDFFDEEPVEICYSLDELETYSCSISLLEYLAQYSNLLDADASEMFYIEWPSLPNNVSEKDYDACIEFLNGVRLPIKQENESLQVTDSLTIPNAERDAKLSAGYKLYPGVGWVHPDDQGSQKPIYSNNPNNPGELILDLDAMIAYENLSSDVTVLDCNIPDNPHKEYQCFRDAFSNCQLAKVDPDQYTIEGSPIYTNVTITDDCKIYGIIDTTTDVHGDRGIITSTCETLIDNQYGWTITDCDALNYPEMQFNYEMQLYPQILECGENGNTWVRERLECVVD